MSKNMSDPCKPQLCLIQDCLRQNNYNESKCTKLIDELYLCCSDFYKANDSLKKTTCCPSADLLKLKLEQRKLDKTRDAKLYER